ncbi:MAG TPA: dihydrolipoamide acetyltransferase family protein [Gemmatimonadales bacterium]|nr:dihydrolipoamide acetyltransferase family protein [Gemmatimonadales bacterium]
MALIDVVMPQMGESIAEGTLSRWLKKVGDPVKRDEPIFEISTDKVDAEIPAPNAGVLAEILVQEGETVAVQTLVARIDTEAGAAQATAAPAAAPAAAPPVPPAAPAASPLAAAAAPSPPPAPVAPAASTPPTPTPKSMAPPPAAPTPPPTTRAAASGAASSGSPNGGAETAEERLRRKSTPLVRRMAAEHNVDLARIPGSGHAGRVTRDDVLGYLEAAEGRAPAAAAAGAPAAPSTRPAPAAAAAAPAPAPAIPGVDPWPGDRVEPWSRIRRLTAEHMVMSRRVSPHVNTIFEVDYTHVADIRGRRKQEFAERGVNLTFLAFIAKAVASSLRTHPVINAAVGADATIFRRDINLGIAVALDWGLIVPVIRNADELALAGIARAINDLGERARTKRLTPDEVQKGTFTITNPGVFGSVIGTPIINQPQAAILCVGSIGKQPAVLTVDGTDTLAVRLRGFLSLAFDHRIVDGADADRFMAEVKRALEAFPEGAD